MNKELQANTTLSHYRIVSRLGAGGMGEVYLAQDTRLDRKVALKILESELAANRERMRRFVQEAKAASALNHPNILTVHEIGVENDIHFIATEYVDGVTLRQRLREGKMSVVDALDVSHQMAFALTAAHAAGVVHRDIKPENIMLRPDHVVKVLDFGIAKLVETENPASVDTEAQTRAAFKTEPGRVMGTARYMSPEQARGRETDARTDVWSLGIVLYEMVAGRPPFEGETSSHVTVSILEHEPALLARFAPDAPAELQRIVRKCLTKERDERYQTARDLMIDLKNLRRELDLQSEVARSTLTQSTDLPKTGTDGGTLTQTFDPASSASTKAIDEAGPTVETGADQASSVEYFGSRIKRHKKSVILIAALTGIAVAASVFIVNYRSARTLTERDSILLTDFVNATEDVVFDGTLKQALAVQLGQSPFLNIFSEDRVRGVLRMMGRSPDERVTREVAREVCQRQGLKVLLVGSIASLGNHYVITLEAINAQTGDTIANEQVEAENKEQVLRSLGEAAIKLREELGESLQSIQKFDAPIEQATTSSLEALKAFSLGVEQQLKGKFLEAIPFFKRATEIDLNFALAYARMSSMYYNSGLFDLAADASQKAYDLRDRVSERERFFISTGYYDNVTGELEKYLETLELWKHTYSNHAAPPNNLALKYNDLGQFAKAEHEAREAIRLNPNSASGYSLLAIACVGLNRLNEAKQVIRQALDQKLETTVMHRTLYRIAFIEGDATTMQQQIEWPKGKPDEYVAQNWQAETAAFLGQLRKAKEFSNRAFEFAERRDLKDVTAQIAAGAAARDALLGDCSRVKEQTSKALTISRRQLTMVPAANALASCGDLAQAQTIVEELHERFPKDTILNKVSLPLIQARIEFRKGNHAQAIQLLEMSRPFEGYALFQIAYLRGQLYLSLQKGAEAAAEFQTILDNRGWGPTFYFYSLARLGLARAAALSGDEANARKAYQDFFALWKDADPELPILQQARREYEKLK